MSTEELKVVLRRSSEHSGFGFSLLGTTGPPHVIYDIVENSPAADCGVVEAGDVILKVNGTDVHRHTTKEVLKCLRLSEDLVTLELKRDPKLKARIKEQLANTKSPHYIDIETPINNYDYHHTTTSPQHHHHQQHHHEAANKLHYDTTHNYTIQQQQSPTSSSPAATRYKSPTSLPLRQSSNTTTNHSRSSSASSAKIQIIEGLGGGGGGGGGGSGAGTGTSTNTATSPTSRPSRIPQALKCPTQPKPQQSPQHKRPRPSQIPTKGSIAASAAAPASSSNPYSVGTTAPPPMTNTTNGNSLMGPHNLQHSNSYSGNTTRQTRTSSHSLEERDQEPNSAPPQPATKAPRFEAFMMTGDLILNLSRTPQNSNLLPVQAKKVDSLRDSPNRAAVARANGALAPKASGESSPTSSSSQESPTHTNSTDSAELKNKEKSRLRKNQAQAHHQQQQQQYQRDSINNSYNNRKDSLTNDTLLLCEELERDDDDEDEDDDEEDDDDEDADVGHRKSQQPHPHHHHRKQHHHHHHYVQKHKRYQMRQQPPNKTYEYYQNEDEEPDGGGGGGGDNYDQYDEENEEDQTHYDITNLETYNSGGGGIGGGMGISQQADDEASDRQCLVQYGDDDDDDQLDDGDSLASASTKQRIKALKQKAALRYKQRNPQDTTDCARTQRSSASSTSSTTVGGGGGGGVGGNPGGGGNNTSQDETSFSVPTSPISLSTPLIDKETANSVPTSPEPSNLAGVSGVAGTAAGQLESSSAGVVRRHNGQIVRKCDSAGFRTSKSEDHLQQIQREGMGAVIPIDIDEDVNSSLNTLLDTRQDSEDSQQSQSSSSSIKTCIQLTNNKKYNNNNNNKNNNNNNLNTTNAAAAAATTLLSPSRTPTPTPTTNILCASPEARSQRDIFNKRRRKVRIIITPSVKITTTTMTTTTTSEAAAAAEEIETTTAAATTSKLDSTMMTTTTLATCSSSSTESLITTTTTTTIIPQTTTTTTLEIYTNDSSSCSSSSITLQKNSDRDRIVWTYNAPLQPHQLAALQQQQQQQQQQQHQYSTNYPSNNSHNHSHSSSMSSSPQHSAGSPASPTSVSSSVMSSSGSKGALGIGGNNVLTNNNNGHGVYQQQQQQQQQYNVVVTNGSLINSCGTNNSSSITTNMGLLHCPNNSGGGGGGGGSGGGGNSSGGGNSCTNTNNTLGGCGGGGGGAGGGDQSVSEAISNISSPDYQDDDNLLSSRDLLGGMILSDPSDSDSTILVSDAAVQRQTQQHQRHQQPQQQQKSSEHKVVIQVRGADNSINSNSNNGSSTRSYGLDLRNSEDELATIDEDAINNQQTSPNNNIAGGDGRESSPPVSDDGSDVESLHSYHYSPKAVDMPSAIRLAKRLYTLDGFKKSDVSRHLSKNNDFNRAVADEYLKYFSFETKTLDQSLREFLQQFSLSGETQERERVLVHFSKRYLDCNPGTFNSQDAVHTLTCAIMLLNTDLHGQNIGRKMTCNEFIENLAELNDGENFPKDVLKSLYQAIKSQPLEWALDDDPADLQKHQGDNKTLQQNSGQLGQNPFLDLPEAANAVEYKKGYVMRKCCYDVNYKKTPFGKRSWKMFYCTLRDLVLYLHKDEHGFRKSQMSDNLHNAIRIHHALATKATDYTKKQHVFRLQTADQAEYLFQTSDSKELQSWVETINFVCAAYSAPPLEGGVGSQKRFQRPLLPSSHTKLLLKEQLESHEQQLNKLENTILEHKKGPIPSKGLALQNYKEKETFLQYELRRYKAYVSILTAKLLADQQQFELQQCNQLNEKDTDEFFTSHVVAQQPIRLQPLPTSSAAPDSINATEQQQQQQQQSSQSQPQSQQQSQPQSGNRKKDKKK